MNEKVGDLHRFRSKNVAGIQETHYLHPWTVFGSNAAEISSLFIPLEKSWIQSPWGGAHPPFEANHSTKNDNKTKR